MNQIRQDIKKNEIKTLYLLYGEEDYLRHKLKTELKEAVAGEGQSMNYAYYEGKNVEAADVIEFAKTLPFFADRRLVIVEDAAINSNAPDEWIQFLQEIPQTACVVLVEKKVDKRSRLFKVCKKYGVIADLEEQKETVLIQWVKEILEQKNHVMGEDTIRYFLGRVSNNMGIIQNELEKLCFYSMEQKEITKKEVEEMTSETIENHIFEMLDAAVRCQPLKVFQLYYDLLSLKEAPMKILILLTRQINIVLQIKDHLRLRHSNAEIAKAVGVPPFVVNKNTAAAKQITYKKLKGLLSLSVQLEEDIKLGKMKDNIAVEMLLTQCCKAE